MRPDVLLAVGVFILLRRVRGEVGKPRGRSLLLRFLVRVQLGQVDFWRLEGGRLSARCALLYPLSVI